jgi:hypothetical protein
MFAAMVNRDVMTECDQALDDVGADELRAADDQNLHSEIVAPASSI